MTQVDTHQRGAPATGQFGGTQDGAVAAEHHRQFDRALVQFGFGHRLQPAGEKFSGDQVGSTVCFGAVRVGLDQDTTTHLRLPAGPAAIAAAIISSISVSASVPPVRRWMKYSTLPRGPGKGLATMAITLAPKRVAARATVPIASARKAGSRTTPPEPIRSLPTSNWGLTSSNRSASCALTSISAGSTRVREMKERSATTSSAAAAS